MKPIKEFKLKEWAIVYIVGMIILALLSPMFDTVGINIHAAFIFSMALFIHLFVVFYKHLNSNSIKETIMKYLLLGFALFSMSKLILSEFYTDIPIFNPISKIWFVVLMVSVIVNYLGNIKKKRDEESTDHREDIKTEPPLEEQSEVDIHTDESALEPDVVETKEQGDENNG